MFSCKKTSKLVAEKRARKLKFSERVSYWIHLVICSPCRCFARVQDLIDQVVRHGDEAEFFDDETASMTVEQKQRVDDAVRRAIHSESE